MEYGKESLNNMIDSSLINTKVVCGELDCYAIISLVNGKEIKLKINLINVGLIYIEDEKKKVEMWVNWFKESKNYKQIKEKSWKQNYKLLLTEVL